MDKGSLQCPPKPNFVVLHIPSQSNASALLLSLRGSGILVFDSTSIQVYNNSHVKQKSLTCTEDVQ